MNTYQAKRIPLSDILARLGYKPTKARNGELWYLSPFHAEDTPSFKIHEERNIFYDFSLGKGGNVLDFVMQYFKLTTITHALQELDRLDGWSKAEMPVLTPETAVAAPQLGKTEMTITKVQPLANRALIDYVHSRGIPVAMARPFVQEVYYTRNGKSYFALAFPNESGGYEIRNRYFKGGIGTKDIALVKRENNGGEAGVMVFEGFMDMLSAFTHFDMTQPDMNVLVLNSVAMKQRAIAALQNMNVTQIHLFLDRDTSGRTLTREFQESFRECAVMDRSDIYLGYKDFNAFLAHTKHHERA